MVRSYRLVNARGNTSRRFWDLVEAFMFLKKDSPDLVPRDLVHTHVKAVSFADGSAFFRDDVPNTYVPKKEIKRRSEAWT